MTRLVIGAVCAWAGAILGALAMSLMVAARRGDDQAEQDEARRN